MLARNAIRDVAPLRRNMQLDGMPSCIRSVVRETDMQRRTFLGTTVLGATLMTVSAPALQAANTEWDKTFALDDRVAHEKVRFTNRFGIELAADLYRPKNLTGKLPAIAVSGPSPLTPRLRARAAASRATSRRPTSTRKTSPRPSTIFRFATTSIPRKSASAGSAAGAASRCAPRCSTRASRLRSPRPCTTCAA